MPLLLPRRAAPPPFLTCLAYSPASSHSPPLTHIAIVWFKHDLRLDDHPGLLSAASAAYDSVVPLYIFDAHMLRWWSSDRLEALVEAVADLRRALRSLGSDLIIRSGSMKDELRALAQEVQASDIITEQEIEHEWCEVLSSLSSDLQVELDGRHELKLQCWTSPLYEVESKQLPSSYKKFRQTSFPVNSPLKAPTFLPSLPKTLDEGDVPTVSALQENVRQTLDNNIWLSSFRDLQSSDAESLMELEEGGNRIVTLPESSETTDAFQVFFASRDSDKALDKTTKGLIITDNLKTGASVDLVALDGYLRFLEPTWRDDWKRLHEAVLDAERRAAREGASFRILFGSALALGTLSRRRIYHEALEYEKARNGGWSSPFGFSTFTAAAAVQEMKSMEWYQMLAAVTQEDSRKKGWIVRTWCWQGFLIQYHMTGSYGPAIVLVHGFGAFWEHFRDNIKGLSQSGNRVWALTLLGFGRSEKPNVVYTELFWAELIRDFIVEVVGEAPIIVGNSIGGYVVSVVAGLWPQIIRSLILLNTAGAVIPDYSSLKYLKPRTKSGVAQAGSQLILSYLRWIGAGLLKICYPVNPSRAEDWLVEEVIRASHDPGAAMVLESLFRLRQPLPINFFIDRYKGKVYVVRGIKDPLDKTAQRTEMLKRHCSNVVVKLLDAGHCPHDESPEEVNKLIIEWIQESVFLQEDVVSLAHVG